MSISYPDDPPPEPGFSRAQIQIRNVAPSSTNTSSLKQKRSHLGANRWAGTLVVDDMDQSRAPEWTAWITKMSGHTGTFRLGDPGYPGPRGDVQNTGTVWQTSAASGPDQTWVIAEGYQPNATIFRRGDQVEINGDLKIIGKDVQTNDNGRALMHVIPRVRDTNIEGQDIIHENPRGLFRLDQAVSQWDDRTILTMLEFPILEVVE